MRHGAIRNGRGAGTLVAAGASLCLLIVLIGYLAAGRDPSAGQAEPGSGRDTGAAPREVGRVPSLRPKGQGGRSSGDTTSANDRAPSFGRSRGSATRSEQGSHGTTVEPGPEGSSDADAAVAPRTAAGPRRDTDADQGSPRARASPDEARTADQTREASAVSADSSHLSGEFQDEVGARVTDAVVRWRSNNSAVFLLSPRRSDVEPQPAYPHRESPRLGAQVMLEGEPPSELCSGIWDTARAVLLPGIGASALAPDGRSLTVSLRLSRSREIVLTSVPLALNPNTITQLAEQAKDARGAWRHLPRLKSDATTRVPGTWRWRVPATAEVSIAAYDNEGRLAFRAADGMPGGHRLVARTEPVAAEGNHRLQVSTPGSALAGRHARVIGLEGDRLPPSTGVHGELRAIGAPAAESVLDVPAWAQGLHLVLVRPVDGERLRLAALARGGERFAEAPLIFSDGSAAQRASTVTFRWRDDVDHHAAQQGGTIVLVESALTTSGDTSGAWGYVADFHKSLADVLRGTYRFSVVLPFGETFADGRRVQSTTVTVGDPACVVSFDR